MNTFFVSCPLDFENELAKEIESFWFQLMDLDGLPTREILPEFTIIPGGLEFKTPLHLGLQINFFSKLALRILLRLGHFEARYFDQFEKGLAKIEIEKYLDPQKINIQIESAKSRLFHEGNLLEASVKVLAQKKYIHDKESEVGLFLRLSKDRVMVSLDTTGKHLHFRGYRLQQGEAPLRENLASLILQLAQLPPMGEHILLDPYCGSGTFFFESQIKNFPNLNRDYAFFKFKNRPALFKSETWKKNYRWIRLPGHLQYIGIEKNPETHTKSLKNVETFQSLFGPIKIDFLQADSETYNLDVLKEKFGTQKVTLITNPPYGERSAAGNVIDSLCRFEQIENLAQVIVIHPESWKFPFTRLKLKKQIPLSNQGLKTLVSIWS